MTLKDQQANTCSRELKPPAAGPPMEEGARGYAEQGSPPNLKSTRSKPQQERVDPSSECPLWSAELDGNQAPLFVSIVSSLVRSNADAVNTFKPIKGPPSYSSMLPTDWEAGIVRTFLKNPARTEIRVGMFECSLNARYDDYSVILFRKEISIHFIAKYCGY